jgi:predicted nucleotidyltransferase
MVTKKNSKKSKKESKKKTSKKSSKKSLKSSKKKSTINLKNEHDIAMDFAVKVSQQFNKIVKSIVLFGSSAKKEQTLGSDIDIVIIIDDASIKWDQELISWYREELEKIIKQNPYKHSLHINTVKLSTWWEDLMRGDPLVLNILRYGEAMIDLGGFFNPLKNMLIEGKIKSTPEAIYSCLKRAPLHLVRSRQAELGAIDGLYWCMVDAAHAVLIASRIFPPSPEHIPGFLKENFVHSKKLKPQYVDWMRDLTILHKKISHHEIQDLKGVEIDMWQNRTEEFLKTMTELVKMIIG